MRNSKLKNLILDIKEIKTIEDLTMNKEEDEEELENYYISLHDYRKGSEDVFYNIFLIFTYNFQEQGSSFFFQWIFGILNDCKINEAEISIDQLLVVEVVICTVKAIIDTLESVSVDISFLVNFVESIINSNALNNERLIHTFLVFLDAGSPFLGKIHSLFPNLCKLLVNISKYKQLESISTYVLVEISDFLRKPDVECFKFVYSMYEEIYNILNPQSLFSLVEVLCNLIAIKETLHDDVNQNFVDFNEEEVFSFFSLICKSAFNNLNMFKNAAEVKISPTEFKSEVIKNFEVVNVVLKKSFYSNLVLFGKMFDLYMNSTFETLSNMLQMFNSDATFVRELVKIFLKILEKLGSNIVKYFDSINSVMLSTYLANPENIICIQVLSSLYAEAGKVNPDYREYLGNNLIPLVDRIYTNMIQLNKNHIDIIEIIANLMIKSTETLTQIKMDFNVLQKIISLFFDALKSISEPNMIRSILKFFYYLITFNELYSVEYVSQIFNEIVVHSFLYIDHYEYSSTKDLSMLASALAKFNPVAFSQVLKEVLIQLKKFNEEQMNTIIKYIIVFKENDKQVKLLMTDLINIVKGMGQAESLIQYEFKIVMEERKAKLTNK